MQQGIDRQTGEENFEVLSSELLRHPERTYENDLDSLTGTLSEIPTAVLVQAWSARSVTGRARPSSTQFQDRLYQRKICISNALLLARWTCSQVAASL